MIYSNGISCLFFCCKWWELLGFLLGGSQAGPREVEKRTKKKIGKRAAGKKARTKKAHGGEGIRAIRKKGELPRAGS